MNRARSIANKNLLEIAKKIKTLGFKIEDIKKIYNLTGQPGSPNWSGVPSGKGGVSDSVALSAIQREALLEKIPALQKQQEDLTHIFYALLSDCSKEEVMLLRAIHFEDKLLPDIAAEQKVSVSQLQKILGEARDKVYLKLTALKTEN